MFSLPVYNAPDFSTPAMQAAPDAMVALAPKDGVAPDNYHATSIYPEYVKLGGKWVLAEESRMDCVMVVLEGDVIAIREFRNLKAGDRVVLGRSEHGEDGVYVHMDGFSHGNENHEQFAFRTSRSRETAYSRDYDVCMSSSSTSANMATSCGCSARHARSIRMPRSDGRTN
jgi:hypothetical protein